MKVQAYGKVVDIKKQLDELREIFSEDDRDTRAWINQTATIFKNLEEYFQSIISEAERSTIVEEQLLEKIRQWLYS